MNYRIRHCRLWLLAMVVIVLSAATSVVGQVMAIQAREASILLVSLFDTERGPAHAR